MITPSTCRFYHILLMLLLFIILLAACSKSEVKCPAAPTTIPKCVQVMIDQDTTERILSIVAYCTSEDIHYLINTTAPLYDGANYIVDSLCNIKCSICGNCTSQSECLKDYVHSEVIWER